MSNQTNFKIVPDEDEIAKMPRDLKFHPVTTTNPQALSSTQIRDYNQNGFVKPIRIFDETEITEIRAYFDELLARVLAAGGDSYSISTAHLKHGRVYDLLRDSRIAHYLKDVLGPDVIGWGSHFFCKMPHDGKAVSWHQDATYWPLTPSKTATVWLAIDDADPENANMRFIAGSHQFGVIDYRQSSETEANVLNQTVENPEQYGTIVDDTLKAGEISIHTDLLLHGSEANTSDRRRCGLTLRYCTPDVRAGLDWNQKGVIVSGDDPSGHWLNPPRPEND